MSVSDDPWIGRELAGFRLQSVVGRGGMGIVYLADQVRLGRRVAVKVLAPDLAHDEAFRERFEAEWRVAARLEHPNIVPVYEAGEAEGVLYIAMRYVDGVDLNSLLAREGRLEPGRAVALLRQVASALDAAHASGLVHRDVKPGNILVAAGPAGEAEHVYLTDFGVAKQVRTQPGVTKAGFFVGTVDYAAPEQIEGRPLNGRADVYSLGCVLYQCLTGVLPFEKDSEVAILYAHLKDAPPSVTARRGDLSPAFDEVVARALAKAPADRYGTCRELVDAAVAAARTARPTAVDAGRTVAGEPAPAAVATAPGADGGGPWWRSKIVLGSAAAAVAVLAIGLGVGLSVGGGGGETQAAETTEPDPGEEPAVEPSGEVDVTDPAPPEPPPEPPPPPDTGTAPPETETAPPPADDFPNELEAVLLRHVPERFRATCEREDAENFPTRAVAGVFCTTRGDVRVFYDQFPSRRSMNTYYGRWVRASGATRGDGFCGSDVLAEGTYDQGGRYAGRLVCWTDSQGRPTVVWTNERLNIVSYAFHTKGNSRALYTWWTNAGPLE